MSKEQDYFDALKRIAKRMTPEQIARDSRNAEAITGLTYEEYLAAAYENTIKEAKTAIRGKRRPAC